MIAVLAFLRGVPVLVWPLVVVIGLWLNAKHTIKELKTAEIVAQAKRDHDVQAANLEANQAAFRYEEWKARQEPKKVYITRKVKDALAATPDFAIQPLPDRVLDAIAAATAVIDPTQPDGAVREASPAKPEDERRPGGSLRLGVGRVGELFRPTAGAGPSSESEALKR